MNMYNQPLSCREYTVQYKSEFILQLVVSIQTLLSQELNSLLVNCYPHLRQPLSLFGPLRLAREDVKDLIISFNFLIASPLYSDMCVFCRSCDKLRCTSCDFKVCSFDNYEWHPDTDYLFLRNNAPDYHRLKTNLVPKRGTNLTFIKSDLTVETSVKSYFNSLYCYNITKSTRYTCSIRADQGLSVVCMVLACKLFIFSTSLKPLGYTLTKDKHIRG